MPDFRQQHIGWHFAQAILAGTLAFAFAGAATKAHLTTCGQALSRGRAFIMADIPDALITAGSHYVPKCRLP